MNTNQERQSAVTSRENAEQTNQSEHTGGELAAAPCSADWSWLPPHMDHVKDELEAIYADSVTIEFFKKHLNCFYPGWPTQMQHCRELHIQNIGSQSLQRICPACQIHNDDQI